MTKRNINVGKLSLIKPRVNFANSLAAQPGQEWGPRTIPDCQLIYITSGQGTLYLGPGQYKLATGDCIFYGINSPHRLVSSDNNPLQFMSIHFDWDVDSPEPVFPVHGISNCGFEVLDESPYTYKIEMDNYGMIQFPYYFSLSSVEALFVKIVREYRFEEHGYIPVLQGLLIQLLTIILRFQINGQYSIASRRKIAPALEMIRKQPNVNWTTTQLAEICGYHPTYFASLFRETTGHSPKRYIILERIRKAKQLLIESMTVDEVADQLGYTSIHYFCRNFKTETGLTPTEYKLQSVEL